MVNTIEIVEGDALKKYGNSGHGYTIPFTLRSPDYGRIEVHLCPTRAPRTDKIGKLIFTFYQTKDPELYAKEFHIPCLPTEGLGTFRADNGKVLGGFFEGIWRVTYCRYHKTYCMLSYPPDGATSLKISLLSSTATIYYE